MEDSGSTRRVTADEMDQLKELLDENTTELTIEVSADVLARIDTLLSKMGVEDGSSGELQFAMGLRQVFMAGLYTLEREFLDE